MIIDIYTRIYIYIYIYLLSIYLSIYLSIILSIYLCLYIYIYIPGTMQSLLSFSPVRICPADMVDAGSAQGSAQALPCFDPGAETRDLLWSKALELEGQRRCSASVNDNGAGTTGMDPD